MTEPSNTQPLHMGPLNDSRRAQATRVADYLDTRPDGATRSEIEHACDPGSVTKLLSEMRRGLGYVVAKRRGAELTKAGTRRRTMLYVLVSRPEGRTQGNLFDEVTR